MSSITALDLSRNTHFGNDGLFNFITSYRESNSTFHLKSLCLRNTGLDGMWRDSAGLSGIVSLSHFLSLPVNSITALDVSENHLFGDEGVALFFKNMCKNTILKYLNMSECAITSRASSNHIAKYINGNKVGHHTVVCVMIFCVQQPRAFYDQKCSAKYAHFLSCVLFYFLFATLLLNNTICKRRTRKLNKQVNTSTTNTTTYLHLLIPFYSE